MKAYLKELARQLLGTVTDHPDVLDHFSTDASIFQATPTAVVYPQNTADVRKIVQFVAARTSAGKPLSITPRGLGADQGGGALGEGLQVVFPTHMHKLIRLDHGTVTVQPGISYKTLQQTLLTHGYFLPSYPDNLDNSTIGGAVANNTGGEKSVKYGATRDHVKGLKAVLADGSLVQTRRLSARELNRKKGLSTLEGEIYRKLDSLILDHAQLIAKSQPRTSQNTSGYALSQVRHKDGSFDLGQIFIGAQGTLGPITEVTLKTSHYNPRTTLVVGYLQTIAGLDELVMKLRNMGVSALEMVDATALEEAQSSRPGDLEGLLPDKLPKLVLLAEFDDFSQLKQKLQSNRAQRLLARHGATVRAATDPLEQIALWKIRSAVADASTWLQTGAKQPLPFINDAVVPSAQLGEFLDKTTKLLKKYDLEAGIWGSAGDGRLHLYPRLTLSRKKDITHLLHLSREFHEMVIALGGTTSGSGGDGLLRSLYLEKLYGEEMMELFASVKHIFDPHGIFNPALKTGATEEYLQTHLRASYVPTKSFEYLNYS